MGAEMQHCIGPEVFRKITIKGSEGVRRREAAFEQQPHGIALVSESGLDADQHIAEFGTENKN